MDHKCPQCGREFKNDLALKIHIGRLHKAKPGRKRGRPPKARNVCKRCGRSFKLPMHLARHVTASHAGWAKAAGRTGRGPGRPKGSTALNVSACSIDQLLDLKRAVDSRLRLIARRMKDANIAL